MAGKGILLGEDNDLMISGKSLMIGESEMQETAIILQMNQGEAKMSPILGPNLVTMMRGSQKEERVKRAVRVHLAMDNKDYETIKNKIKFG